MTTVMASGRTKWPRTFALMESAATAARAGESGAAAKLELHNGRARVV